MNARAWLKVDIVSVIQTDTGHQIGFGIFPFHGTIDAGNHAGAALQTPGKFDSHLFFSVRA
jgi:hypothetical protein